MEEAIRLLEHVVAMKDDVYLKGHPEFVAIVDEAEEVLEVVRGRKSN